MQMPNNYVPGPNVINDAGRNTRIKTKIKTRRRVGSKATRNWYKKLGELRNAAKHLIKARQLDRSKGMGLKLWCWWFVRHYTHKSTMDELMTALAHIGRDASDTDTAAPTQDAPDTPTAPAAGFVRASIPGIGSVSVSLEGGVDLNKVASLLGVDLSQISPDNQSS